MLSNHGRRDGGLIPDRVDGLDGLHPVGGGHQQLSIGARSTTHGLIAHRIHSGLAQRFDQLAGEVGFTDAGVGSSDEEAGQGKRGDGEWIEREDR